ncbi:cytochrome d ubiquinol oxidase subunit II [Devosia sp. 63-57]|uniref:cytochrome d ubiquinol oxidase subunit II n=1 Tax=Devosia sp. 63-57 TaxID=1895751 RepID=UPI00086D3785|nr:cytochrome d ubiquinol oxidase subunit II [Devosia sp. 63-57]ODT47446.1 MAG: cytochrome d ubiquinol oxidase subunit II [Pelagibacterium sp. SCN 63-126]ODU87122.1 MAG: cytochrome d ubiquinol oxidase subunit II [Pelagibacterium sp. SCN 63-17]OJX42846.1 MAG: cytochrome d ubiquinol oxidase subunit II [Devosia sp. 63-57]
MSTIPLDYETLRLIWWLLLGVLLIGFAIMGGRDMGVGALLPFAAKTDEERRVLLNLIGPTWEGNQVWLILGGGAIFAAFPPLYAVSFSGFYLAMMVILLALILRPVGFKFRGKIEDPRWRKTWDWGLFIGGFVPALIMGVAVGNVLLGAPFHIDDTMRIFYTGNFFQLLMPFALLAGLVSVGMIVTHGATLIVGRTEGVIAERARTIGIWSGLVTAALFALGGVWLAFMNGYVVTSVIDPNAPINPLSKTVELVQGGWLRNYGTYPWMIAAPVLGLAGMLVAVLALNLRMKWLAYLATSGGIFGIVSTAGLSIFPFFLPSSTVPNSGLTLWDASSSHMTLFIMLVVTVIFLPIIIGYTAWVFRVMRGTVTPQTLGKNPNAY